MFVLDDTKIVKMPNLNYIPDSRGVGWVYFDNMTKNKDLVAQIDGITGVEDTFGALLQRSICTAIKMRAMGVEPKDIITICSPNHLNSCVPFIATFFLGATISSLDPNLSVTDMKHLLKLVKPKMMFTSEESLETLDQIIKELNLDTALVVFGNAFATFLKDVDETSQKNFQPIKIGDLGQDAIIVFSSGTTGLPKGIRKSHRTVLGQSITTQLLENCYDRILTFASLYWGSSIHYLSLSLIAGYSRVIVPKFDISTVWTTIEKSKPTFMFISPYISLSMYKTRSLAKDFSSLKSVTIGGGPLSLNQISKLKKLFSNQRVFLSYGMSEAGFSLYFKNGNKQDDSFLNKKILSCGSGLYGFSYKIVDIDSKKTLGPNKKGELRLKSQYMLSGYLNMTSDDIWDEDGFIKTGDIAYYDEDGYFYVVDRLKEVLKYQSFHVLPSNIENVLLNHESVTTAVVCGVPHKINGEHPAALVVLNSKSANVTENDLIEYVSSQVHDREKLRGGVRIVEEVPLTATGKINRRAVKELFKGLH